MNKKVTIALYILAILFGAFLFVYGEQDDSPGAQLLGAVIAVLGIAGLVQTWRKRQK